MRTSLFLIGVLLLATLATPAMAGWDEGVAAFTSKNFQAAAAEFQELVDQNPEGYRGHYMLGLSLQQLNRKEEALHHLRKAYDLNPNDLNTKLALGRAYFNMRRYSDVNNLLKSVDASSLGGAQQAAFYQMRGKARVETGANGGVDDFKRLAQLKSNDANIQYQYGALALKANQVDTAIAALRKASQLAPKDPDKQRAYIQALIRKGRETRGSKDAKKSTYVQAAQVAEKLVAMDASYDNLMLLVSAQLGGGLYTEAATSGQKALAKKSTDWLAHYYLGQALSSSGKFAESEAPLLKAKEIAKSPNDLKLVHRQLGFIYERQQKYTKSIEYYTFAGDQGAVARVKENEATALYNEKVEEENAIIREMEAEAKKLEEELKTLEGGGGR